MNIYVYDTNLKFLLLMFEGIVLKKFMVFKTAANTLCRCLIQKRRRAFTLAEILITLGIIGVIAAMTIPALTSACNRHITETRLKHIYATILQGFRLYQAEYGAFTDLADENTDVNGYSYTRSQRAFEQVFVPVFSGTRIPKDKKFPIYLADGTQSSWSYTNFTFFYSLNNGTVIGFTRAGNYDGMTFTIIINPQKKKLKAGRDVFQFIFQTGFYNNENYVYKPLFGTMYDTESGKEQMVQYCKSSSSYPANFSSVMSFCTHLIVLNNFKIPKNYPIKF